MAKRMVTRTISFAEVECTIANMDTMAMEKKVFSFAGNLTKSADILDDIKSENETENVKILSVNMDTVKREEIIYGMPEAEFIKNAVRMDTRTKVAE